jgi:hypothetical protein
MRGYLLAGFVLACLQSMSAEEPPAPQVEFNRDIRPILSDKCFVCHGPDSAKRQAGLRLDQRESAIAVHEGSQAITPGRAEQSKVYLRVVSTDPDLQMPPPKSNLKLSPAEIDLLRRWINAGAEYQPHWSFIPPQRVTPPVSTQSPLTHQPLDSFIQARLQQEGLIASIEADRRTLVRRVTLDLTGLPPSRDDVAAFVADSSPDAYEKLVDRLLASPRYGERMALNWLDAARFADTNGYQTDGPRFMWRWRDWVIEAFNQNQPFDEFTIDQLAGDLIEEQTASTSPIANARLIATGFNRNHRGNAEGGIIPEEFRVEYVVDRVETTSAVWLGLTIGCARCHDHKYDPISQRDFYQLFAFFNQVPEPGKYIRNDNSMPYLPAPTHEQQRHLTALKQERDAAESAWHALAPQIDKGIAAMAASIRSQGSHRDWSVSEKLDAKFEFDGDSRVVMTTNDGQPFAPNDFVWKHGRPTFAEGCFGQAAALDGDRWIESQEAGDFAEDESLAISCWVKPTGSKAMTILARMDHDNASRGYELRREANGHLQVLFSGRILDDLIRVETAAALPVDRWSHLFVSYDGSSAARGVAIRINGESTELKVITDLLSNPIKVKLPLCIGAGGSAAPFKGAIDELRTYRGRLTAESAIALAARYPISQIAARPIDDQIPRPELQKLRECYLAEYAPKSEQSARAMLLLSRQKFDDYLATIPTTMVMQDRLQRDSFVLKRGEYDKPGEQVQAALPASLPAPKLAVPKSGQSLNRLDLARWLVSSDNPLTARVTVNRLWQSLFGVGLVKTAEDFGTQGESPSHPELLDWLALEFSGDATMMVADRWDLKRALRHMLTSATYRQSSAVNEPRDPDNRWLARGPRFRLPAEMIRDAALASSGLLVETVGGPSVKPYQPAGIWEELSAEAVPGPFAIYVQDHGPNLYRRGIYTFRKRTVPPPALAIFDASPREACRVSLPRTNTPLQALNLMNDVTYVEAARALAELAMKEGGASAPSRLTFAFRQVLSRDPDNRELKVLVDGFERRRQAYQQHPAQAAHLLKLGETVADTSLNPLELAAYTATASVIFNIDEFVAKP